jgi:hypothetical protein
MGFKDATFMCGVCCKVFQLPLSIPFGHNFCKPFLDVTFDQQSTQEWIDISLNLCIKFVSKMDIQCQLFLS